MATGEIEPGTKLPPGRALAQRLGVAVDTVRQAYDGLAQSGFAETRPGVGTRVTLPVRSAVPGDDPWDLRQTAKVDAALLGLLADGVTPAVAGQAVRQRLAMLSTGLRVSFIGVRASAERYAATGLEHTGHRILAVQWHPEELIRTSPQSQALFHHLIGRGHPQVKVVPFHRPADGGSFGSGDRYTLPS
ncbi:GntR family transcriptional regulator [Spongiactinospora gelatinilytica]|uniref:GntR family transcriptional regulator n=1 Tax=Spongiactinospora gelatinilytica TaxID=2666298 RepID=UPI002279ADFB|nr:GntR family transcriptional regulator [Spongiactinospora gelatinilytica]